MGSAVLTTGESTACGVLCYPDWPRLSALDLDRLTDLEGEVGGAGLLGRLAVLDELHDPEGGLGDPHALAGVVAGRGVVAARHLAAVRARVHDSRGLQVRAHDLDHRGRVEGAVVADEDQALVRAGFEVAARPGVVDGGHRLAGHARLRGLQGGPDRARLLLHGGRGRLRRRLVERERAHLGRLGQHVAAGTVRPAGGGVTRARRGRTGARRALTALGQVDGPQHDRHHGDGSGHRDQDHLRLAGALPHTAARPLRAARARPRAAAGRGGAAVVEAGRAGAAGRLEGLLAVPVLAAVAVRAVGVLAVARRLLVGVLAGAGRAVPVLSVVVLAAVAALVRGIAVLVRGVPVLSGGVAVLAVARLGAVPLGLGGLRVLV